MESKTSRRFGYNLFQFLDDRSDMTKAQWLLDDLEGQYYSNSQNFGKMGLTEQASSRAMLSKMVKMLTSSFLQKLILMIGLASIPVNEAVAQQGERVGKFGNLADGWARQKGTTAESANSLDDFINILVGNPDLAKRMKTLNDFQEKYQQSDEFVAAVQKIALAVPARDVVIQELFRTMVGRQDHDPRFFVQMMIKGEQKNNQDLVALAYQSLKDVLGNNPKILDELSPNDFSANPLYPDVSPESAEKALLTLLEDEQLSQAQGRITQSDYWDSDNLARKYNDLIAWTEKFPYDPQVGRIKKLIIKMHNLLYYKAIEDNIPTSFSFSGYDHLAFLNPLEDFMYRVELENFSAETTNLLGSLPSQEQMQKLIKPELYARATNAVNDLLARNPSTSTPSGLPIYIITPGIENRLLAHFSGLKPELQTPYMSKSKNAELARMLKSKTLHRDIALVQLWESDLDGRIWILKDYLDTPTTTSEGTNLLSTIEKYDWQNIANGDALALKDKDPASKRIFIDAMDKMATRLNQPELRYASWNTLSTMELYERGLGEQLKFVATQWALQAILEKDDAALRPVTGFGTLTEVEINVLKKLRLSAKNSRNPTKFNNDFDNEVNNAGPQTKAILNEVKKTRDTFFDRLMKNDQSINKIKKLSKNLWTGVLWLTEIFLAVHAAFMIRKETAGVPTLIKILEKELESKRKDGNGNGNGNGGNHARQAITYIPQNGFTPVYNSLVTWERTVAQWQPSTTADDMLNDFNIINNNAYDTLRQMPYSADLVDTNKEQLNGKYNRTLKSFYLLAGKTLDGMSDRVNSMHLTPEQRADFKNKNGHTSRIYALCE